MSRQGMVRGEPAAAVGRAALACLILCALSGCASGAFDSERPYQQVYMLAGLPPRPASAALLPADVAVAQPQVRPGLDTDRIAVLYPDRRLDYFAGSRWGGATDRVVQSLLVESLRNAAGLRSVQGEVSVFAAEFVMQTEVTAFQAEYGAQGGPPQAHVQLLVTFGRLADRRPLSSFVCDARVAAESNSLQSVLAAFEQAWHQAAGEIVDRTRAALEQPQPTGQ